MRTNLTELFSLAGKTALVTGGSSGIGRCIAQGLLDAGAKVYISSRRKELGAEVAAELSSDGGACTSIPADVSIEAGCRALAEELATRESALHVLVNNAGTSFAAPLEGHDEASWSTVLDLNVKAPFHLVKFCFPLLDKAATDDDPARVVNVTSAWGLQVPPAPVYSYSTSKAALHHLTRHLARDLAPRITVNAIAPGPFPSEMMAPALEHHSEVIASKTALKRIGRPDDLAGAAVFLASRAGAYVTGAIVPVDGGMATTR